MADWQDKLPPRARERLAQIGEVKPISRLGITQEAFQKAIQQKMREKGLSFVLALYQTLDEFVQKEINHSGIVLACKRGCSHCCHQMITCTEIEMNEIIRFINGLPRTSRVSLQRRVRDAVREWRDYFEKNGFELKINPFKVYNDWQGKPCPFLNEEGACEVYPVRIIDCRTASSTIPCGPGVKGVIMFSSSYEEGPGRCRFPCELWANNLIIEEQLRGGGLSDPRLISVTPLHHWLWMRKKELS